ncbi:WD40-repeat-containing domain protein [Chytriomyces sp. MP71]|nr:WD40-repeat-containing domain protein [Chytriomyces sp. MP71]
MSSTNRNAATARSTHSIVSSSHSSLRESATDTSGFREGTRTQPLYSHRSLKGSLGSLYSLERHRQRISQDANLGSQSLLSEWQYVLGSGERSSTVPSAAGIDKASVSGVSHATRRTVRGGYREPTFQGVFRPKFIKREQSEVFSLKFSPDDEYIAAALGNSNIQIYSTSSNEMVRTLVPPFESGASVFPCTTVMFRPDSSGYKNKNVLVAGYADGRIIHWHFTSGQVISTIQEEDLQINSIAYQNKPDGFPGQFFAACASDPVIRVYDAQNHKKVYEMSGGQGFESAGHSSRVFASKFHPTDQNILISGGWDNTVQVWDLRVAHSIRSIYGPHICGTDALDFNGPGTEILTASFSKTDQLQTWDYSSGQLIETIPWSIMEGEKRDSLLYSASFGRCGKSGGAQYVVAGGCGPNNEVKMFNLQTKRAIGVAQGFSHSVYSVALSHNEKMVAAGGSFKAVYAYDVDYSQQTNELIY